REYFGRLIFLCASTLGTAQILLSSRSARFPTGLANSSGELGHNLMDHISKAGAHGTVPGLEDKYVYGRRPTGSYIPRFRNLGTPGAPASGRTTKPARRGSACTRWERRAWVGTRARRS